MTTVIAADLDRTLIYSRGAIDAHGAGGAALHPVERYEGVDASWMTDAAARTFAELHRDAVVVPATTRTPDQWRRITLPGPQSRYAVTANGGILLVDGEVDRWWERTVATRLADVSPLATVWDHAARVCRAEWTVKLRNAANLFCYAVLERTRLPTGFVAAEADWAQARGWQVSLQGRKLYWVPQRLTKGAALTEIARRSDGDTILAAGDSLLDADLFDVAGAGIAARHGELVASGWTAPHVSVTEHSGIRAGAEIVEWFRSAVG